MSENHYQFYRLNQKEIFVPEDALKIGTLQKAKHTCLEKYGVDNPSKSIEIQQKIKNTFLEKYGVDNPRKSEIVKKKIKQTSLQKYGDQNFNNRQLAKQTCLKRYNKDNPNKVQKFIQKRKQTCLKKYGVQCSFSSQLIKAKIKQTNLKKYGKTHKKIFQSWKRICSFQNIKPLFSFQEFQGGNVIQYKWKCLKCGTTFYSKYDDGCVVKQCPSCLKHILSRKQKQLTDFCRVYFNDLEQHNRKLIKPYQLDIVIKQLKLAIQFNGLYWHNLEHKEKGYHLQKTQMCQKIGYRLIHIWQDEWDLNKDLIKSKLNDIFLKKQIIDYTKPLDRCWYKLNQLEDYDYEIIEPTIENNIQKCGFIVYKLRK